MVSPKSKPPKSKLTKSKPPKSKPTKPFINKKDKKFLLALTLFSLSLFLLGSLIPVSLARFPTGNLMGELGRYTQSVLMSVFGISSIFLCPLLFTLGLHVKGWIPKKLRKRKWVHLWVGLFMLGPVFFRTLDLDKGFIREWGQWGELGGSFLETYLGIFDVVLMVLLLAALFIYTIEWNPINDVTEVFAQGFKGIRRLILLISNRVLERKKSVEDLEDTMPLDLLDNSIDDGWVDDPGEVFEPENGPAIEEKAEEAPALSATEDSNVGTGQTVMELGETNRPPTDSFKRANPEDRTKMAADLDELGIVLIEKLKSFDIDCLVEVGKNINGDPEWAIPPGTTPIERTAFYNKLIHKGKFLKKTIGPAVTQFQVKPAEGVKVSKIQNLEADLALAMKAKSVRIIAPIPGKDVVGVEIPNPKPEFVNLGDILESKAYRKKAIGLPMALGNDLNGKPYIADLTKMPHILIAGATGTGKSVCLNAIITSLIFRHGRETLDLLMVDPKMVELSAYKELPHLRKSVVTDPTKAARALKWAVIEMERRYKLLSLNGVRSIGEFNERLTKGQVELQGYDSEGHIVPYEQTNYGGRVLTYVVVVIDELADLMMTVKNDIEKPLIILAQKARAIGIHLIVATQRPSVNVITGLIKANFPSRIAFRVASKVDSRTILDQNGAETLLGDGDMLFLPPGANEPIRIQGAYISTDETDSIMSWYAEQKGLGNPLMTRPEDEPDILEEQRRYEIEDAVGSNTSEDDLDWDELFRAAAEVCITQDQGSTSLLQRRLKIGYGRAARIVDQLHDAGVLGPPEGSKGREVLVGIDQLDAICGDQGIR